MAHRWQYEGDIDCRHGGLWWRDPDAPDYVDAVQVTPCSNGGGPDNLFHIETGIIYLPVESEERAHALAMIGVVPKDATLGDLVHAFNCYYGIERDAYSKGVHVVQIGAKPDGGSYAGWHPMPDTILRGNASLRRFVRRKFLQ